jgi:hypothetical protein
MMGDWGRTRRMSNGYRQRTNGIGNLENPNLTITRDDLFS